MARHMGSSASANNKTVRTAAPVEEPLSNHAVSPLPSNAGASKGLNSRKPNRGSKGRRIFSTLLLAVGIILLLVAAGMFAVQRWGYYQQDKVNSDLASHIKIDDTPSQGSDYEIGRASCRERV